MKEYGLGLCKAWWACLLLFALLLPAAFAAPSPAIALSAEQNSWLAQHKGQTFTVGFDPFGGVDSFELRGKRYGFLYLLLSDLEKQTGLRLVPATSADWDEA